MEYIDLATSEATGHGIRVHFVITALYGIGGKLAVAAFFAFGAAASVTAAVRVRHAAVARR